MRRTGGGGGCCSKMADEETLLLQPRSGRCAAAESAEPLPKRQRLDSEGGGGRGSVTGKGLGSGRGDGTAPTSGSAAGAPARLQREVAAAADWSGAENGAGLPGLPREEPPPQQQEEGAETAPSGDAVETAIGCRRSQWSHGAADAAAPHPGEDPWPALAVGSGTLPAPSRCLGQCCPRPQSLRTARRAYPSTACSLVGRLRFEPLLLLCDTSQRYPHPPRTHLGGRATCPRHLPRPFGAGGRN